MPEQLLFKPNKRDSESMPREQIHNGFAFFNTSDGKFYIDQEGVRFPINPDMVQIDTTANWNAQTELESVAGMVYVYSDKYTRTNKQGVQVNVPGIKIGDGLAYVVDLPFVQGNDDSLMEHINDGTVHVTQEERALWNYKVSVYAAAESESLVFTTDYYNPDGTVSGFSYLIVEELPEVGEKGIIYLVAHSHGTGDTYDEYIWIEDRYEKLGHTDVDLSGYMQTSSEISNTEIEEMMSI